MILVVLVDALGDEEFAEKLDAVKYSSTLLILSPNAPIRDLISLTTNPTSAGPDNFWPFRIPQYTLQYIRSSLNSAVNNIKQVPHRSWLPPSS